MLTDSVHQDVPVGGTMEVMFSDPHTGPAISVLDDDFCERGGDGWGFLCGRS